MSENEEPVVRAHLGNVLIPRQDSDWGWTDETYTPDAAREHAALILEAAQEAYLQLAAIRNACADGHVWDDGYNWPDPARHITMYRCTREGCEATKDEPGWLPFEPKQHLVMFSPSPRDCTGPGCHYCADEAMAEHMRNFLDDAFISISKDGVQWPQPEAP